MQGEPQYVGEKMESCSSVGNVFKVWCLKSALSFTETSKLIAAEPQKVAALISN